MSHVPHEKRPTHIRKETQHKNEKRPHRLATFTYMKRDLYERGRMFHVYTHTLLKETYTYMKRDLYERGRVFYVYTHSLLKETYTHMERGL